MDTINVEERAAKELLATQREFFNTHITKDVRFRIKQLDLLHQSILDHEEMIFEALGKDLHKTKLEAFEGEIGQCLGEIKLAQKQLRRWSRPQRAPSAKFFPLSKTSIVREPYGVALIFSPFNHPISTSLVPLINAIAAGNCVILKPSEISQHTTTVLQSIITKIFPRGYVAVVEGERAMSEALLTLTVDYLFFTGSTAVGKVVMGSCAQKLIPLTLQLGGKCPGVVHSDASIKKAAQRIVWGKFWNAGQACNTIDHVFVHRSVQDRFVNYLKEYILKFYGSNPEANRHYGRIINDRHFSRVVTYLTQGNIITGGKSNKETRYIAPTLMDGIPEGSAILEEEIFGPILPIIPYDSLDEVLAQIKKRPDPLAVYIFSLDKKIQKKIIDETISGSVCINDLMIQSSSPQSPIGGVGMSGFGRFHGKAGFDTFSYERVIMKQVTFDFPLRFPPYSNEKFILSFLGKSFR